MPGAEFHGPDAGVGALGIEEAVGAFGAVGNGDAVAGGIVASSFEFEMEPHAELLGGGVVDDLGSFEDAAALDVGTAVVADAEGHAAVVPVEEVLGGIAGDADEGIGGPVGLVLAEPVVGVAVVEHTAAVGVDVLPAVIGPEFAGADGGALGLGLLTEERRGEGEEGGEAE